MKKFTAAALNDKRGALMFCVNKGKLTEGMDFKDKLCRSVIFLGVPFIYFESNDVK